MSGRSTLFLACSLPTSCLSLSNPAIRDGRDGDFPACLLLRERKGKIEGREIIVRFRDSVKFSQLLGTALSPPRLM